MTQRWLATGGLVEQRACGLRIPAPSAAWIAGMQKGVRAALGNDRRAVCEGLELLHHVVRARAMLLRRTGWRVDQVLMAVKRDIASCAVTTVALEKRVDPTRMPALLDAVIAWCLGAFYICN